MNIDKRLHRGSVDRGVLKTEREYGKEEGRPGRGMCRRGDAHKQFKRRRRGGNGSHQTWWPGSSLIELRRAPNGTT